MSVSWSDIQELYKKDDGSDLSDREAQAIERYLEIVERSWPGGIDADDAVDNVVARFDLDAERKDFDVGSEDGPWGVEELGFQLVPRDGLDDWFSDDRLVYLYPKPEVAARLGVRHNKYRNGSFDWTSTQSADEEWEEEQYRENPWPKIEADGPGEYEEAIWTPDFVDFYEYNGPWKAGVGRTRGPRVFSVDVRRFLESPDDDPDDYEFDGDEDGYWEELLFAWMKHDDSEHPDAFFWYGRHDEFKHWAGDDGEQRAEAKTLGDEPDSMERARRRYRVWKDIRDRQLSFTLVPMGPDYRPVPIAWGRLAAGRPELGDLFTDHLFARAGWGIVLREFGEPGNTFHVTRAEVVAGRGWTRIAEILAQHSARLGRRARLWSGQPFTGPRSWTPIDLAAPPGALTGLARRRRRRA